MADIERKSTVGASDTGQVTAQKNLDSVKVTGNRGNVLNYYRSYTYNFTLAALDKDTANNPESYRDSVLNYVVLKSGGKGSKGFSPPKSDITSEQQVHDPLDMGDATVSQNVVVISKDEAADLVSNFNQKSAGRFDMYIENVEIGTTMAFSEASSNTLVTGLSFEVFEPLSISGFIEALHFSGVAAGYLGYIGAPFLLKIEFVGYPDSEDITDPKSVGRLGTRYIPFIFKSVSVEAGANGTRYRCVGTPIGDLALGETNRLKSSVQMTGDTVKEVLEDLMTKLSNQISRDDKSSKSAKDSAKSDQYAIEFRESTIDKNGKTVIANIANAKITELLRASAVYTFPDPGDATVVTAQDPKNQAGGGRGFVNPAQVNTDTETYRYEPKKSSIMFANGANINEIISSVIRDSDYLKNLLKTLGQTTTIDEHDMVNFWKVSVDVELGDIDPVTRKNFKKYTYVVSPYKVHYTQIPGYGAEITDEAKVLPLTKRTYHYIYTGKNTDVLNFKLDFNNLFFEALPKALGNNDAEASRDGAAKNNGVLLTQKSADTKSAKNLVLGLPLSRASDNANKTVSEGGNSGPNQTDPYSIAAKNMFRSLINNSQFSMLKGDLEIIGDPFFLVTGGLGNYQPEIDTLGATKDGEADINYGQVLINLNFKNPIDINPLTATSNAGQAMFDPERVSFSGIYRVNRVRSVFKEGVFRQYLDVMRLVGVTPKQANIKISDPTEVIETRPNPLDAVIPDAAPREARAPRTNSILGLIQNVNSIVGTIASVEAKIVNAAQGAVTGVATAVGSVVAIPGQALQKLSNQVSNSLSGIKDATTSAADKLGLTPSQLMSLSAKDIASLAVLSKLIPSSVDLKAVEEQGVVLSTAKALQNVPIPAPKATAPAPVLPDPNIK